MKLSLIGVLTIFSVAVVSYATVMPYNYGYYPQQYGYGNQNSGGFSGFGEGGLFEMIIFLFVFILIIQVLFGSLNGGGLGGGGGGGGGGYGYKKGGSGYDVDYHDEY